VGDTDRERLEARIAEDPDDAEAWKVYADLLQRSGDPRGELIVLQMAADAERAASTSKKAGKAELAARKYLAKHAGALVGPLADLQEHLTWRFGFVQRAAFDARFGEPATSLDQLLEHPSGLFVAELSIKCDVHSRFDFVIDALARYTPAALQALDLYAHAAIDLDRLWPHLTGLRRIALTGIELQLADLALPACRRATFAALVLSPRSMRAIATAPWPVLERLEVRFGSRAPFAPFEDVVPLLRRTDLPALTHLKLRNAPFAGAILRELATHPLGAQLQLIDLSHGQITPQDVQFVGERRHVFRQLRELWLPASALGGDSANQLAGIAKHVVPDSKAPIDPLDRELGAAPGGIRYETIHE
jgi:uncharacterized protein (TIGR02996 family)